MISIAALLAGAVFGWIRAAKRGGNRLDRLQYSAAHGLAFFILGLVVTMVLGSLGVAQ